MSQNTSLDMVGEDESYIYMGPITITELNKIYIKPCSVNKNKCSRTKNDDEYTDEDVESLVGNNIYLPASGDLQKTEEKDYIEILDDSDSTSGIAMTASFSSYKCVEAVKSSEQSIIIINDDSRTENDVLATEPNDRSGMFLNVKHEDQLIDQTSGRQYKSSLFRTIGQHSEIGNRLFDQSAPYGLLDKTFDVTENFGDTNFSKVTAPRTKSRFTICSPPEWRKASDKSFEACEKQSECGSTETYDNTTSEQSINKNSSSSDGQTDYKTARNTPVEKSSDESVGPTVYGTAQNSDESVKENEFITARNSPTYAKNANIISSSNNCSQSKNMKNINHENDRMSTSSFNFAMSGFGDISYGNAREFNDTLEEMEYLLKAGEAYERNKTIHSQKKTDINTPSSDIKQRSFFASPDCSATRSKSFNARKTKQFFSPIQLQYSTFTPTETKQKTYPIIPTYSPSSKQKLEPASPRTATKKPSPLFKLPAQLREGSRPIANKHLRSPIKTNYENIVSPIGIYIARSAQVPLTSIIRADASKKRLNLLNTFVASEESCDHSKENIESPANSPAALPIKAYKSSNITNSEHISPVGIIGPGKSDKIRKLINAIPSHEVLRHERRLKDPHGTRLPGSPLTIAEDSFANMSVSTADVSVCVAKEPLRTNTLEKRNK